MLRIMILVFTVVVLVAAILLVHHHKTIATQISGCVDILANPDYLTTGKEEDAIAAINNAREQEHLHPLHLPANYYALDPVQKQFILINLERTDRRRKPLRVDANLSQLAWGYSKQLLDLHFFSHTSPIGGTFGERINGNPALTDHFSLAAENLAGNPVPGAGPIYEYMYNDSAEACGHRNNILDKQLTLVGIAWIPGGPYGSISAQEFIASASWNPYVGAKPNPVPPHVVIVEATPKKGMPGNSNLNLSITYTVLTVNHVGIVRITWFLDRFGNQPQAGSLLTLNLHHLSSGIHTLFAYAVDGEQNYGVATFKVVV